MFVVNKFISYTATTLKRFIFTATLIVSAVTFTVVIMVVSWLFLMQAQDTTIRESVTVSNHILGSMSKVMERGGDSCNIEQTLADYRKLFPRLTIGLLSTGRPEHSIPANNVAVKDRQAET